MSLPEIGTNQVWTEESFRFHVVDQLARINTSMTSLIGNGQPGRIQNIESDLETTKKSIENIKYKIAYVSGGVALGLVALKEFGVYLIGLIWPHSGVKP